MFAQNNTLFELDSNLQLGMDQITSRENLDVGEIHVHTRVCKIHSHTYVKLVVPKIFRRPWEEILHNKQRIGLRYNKYVFYISFHVPDYSKTIQFCSAIFIDGVVP